MFEESDPKLWSEIELQLLSINLFLMSLSCKDALFGPSSTHYWSIHYWQFTEHRNCFFPPNTNPEASSKFVRRGKWASGHLNAGLPLSLSADASFDKQLPDNWQLSGLVLHFPGRQYRFRCFLSFTASSPAPIWVEGSKFVWMAGCWTNCARRCWSIAPWWSRHANEHLPSLFSTCPC